MGFYTDNKEGALWYQRKSMVVIIGKDLDFEKHKVYKEGLFKKGLVDKSYLIEWIKKMKRKLIQEAIRDFDALDIPGEPTSAQLLIEHMQEPQQEVIEEPRETIEAAQAAEMLGIGYCTLTNLAKKGLIKGENNGSGWNFIKSNIETLLRDRPEFLLKIWNNPKSLRRRGKIYGSLIFEGEQYLHVKRAQKIINLSYNTIIKYAQQGLIKHRKESGKDYYISVPYMEELKANPPDWLKKSWRYFNNGKEP